MPTSIDLTVLTKKLLFLSTISARYNSLISKSFLFFSITFDCLEPRWSKWIENIIEIKIKIKKINATLLKSIFISDFFLL